MTQNSNQTRFSFQFKISILLISSLFSMPACRKVIQPGHYEGNLLRSVETKYQVEPIEFEVSYPRVDRAAVEVKSKSAETISHIVITRPKKHHLLVTLDGAYPGEYLLERIPQKKQVLSSKCFATQGDQHVSLCFNSTQVYFKLLDAHRRPILTISGSQFKVSSPFELETPQEFSLTESVREALI